MTNHSSNRPISAQTPAEAALATVQASGTTAPGMVSYRSRGHLIVLGDAGQLVLVVAAPDEYRERGKVQLFDGKTWTMPTLVDGKLYLRDLGELVALDVSG